LENHREHRVTQRRQKRKITTLYDPLCPLWFNLPYYDQILWKGEKVCALAKYQRAEKLRSNPYYRNAVLALSLTSVVIIVAVFGYEIIRLSGIFRDSEPELYQINHLFSRLISILQSSSGQLKI
jgi:hypothetical protein